MKRRWSIPNSKSPPSILENNNLGIDYAAVWKDIITVSLKNFEVISHFVIRMKRKIECHSIMFRCMNKLNKEIG